MVVTSVIMIVLSLHAQDLLPELAVPAAKYKGSIEALNKQKQEAMAKAAQSYVGMLDGIEKAATAKGDLDLVAAVVQEREAAITGMVDPELPPALPKSKLKMTRKTLLATFERLNEDFAKRRKQMDADYLRVLATHQTKSASNPELAKQVAAEKALLLGNGSVGVVVGNGHGEGRAKEQRGKNVVVNGDFEKVMDGKPEGWERTNHVTVETENGNKFLRFEKNVISDGTVTTCSHILQNIKLPQGGGKRVTIIAKLRTKECVRNRANKLPIHPCVQVNFANRDGKIIQHSSASWEQSNGSWETIFREDSIPKDATMASVLVLNGYCPGQIDFDDVEVTFK